MLSKVSVDMIKFITMKILLSIVFVGILCTCVQIYGQEAVNIDPELQVFNGELHRLMSLERFNSQIRRILHETGMCSRKKFKRKANHTLISPSSATLSPTQTTDENTYEVPASILKAIQAISNLVLSQHNQQSPQILDALDKLNDFSKMRFDSPMSQNNGQQLAQTPQQSSPQLAVMPSMTVSTPSTPIDAKKLGSILMPANFHPDNYALNSMLSGMASDSGEHKLTQQMRDIPSNEDIHFNSQKPALSLPSTIYDTNGHLTILHAPESISSQNFPLKPTLPNILTSFAPKIHDAIDKAVDKAVDKAIEKAFDNPIDSSKKRNMQPDSYHVPGKMSQTNPPVADGSKVNPNQVAQAIRNILSNSMTPEHFNQNSGKISTEKQMNFPQASVVNANKVNPNLMPINSSQLGNVQPQHNNQQNGQTPQQRSGQVNSPQSSVVDGDRMNPNVGPTLPNKNLNNEVMPENRDLAPSDSNKYRPNSQGNVNRDNHPQNNILPGTFPDYIQKSINRNSDMAGHPNILTLTTPNLPDSTSKNSVTTQDKVYTLYVPQTPSYDRDAASKTPNNGKPGTHTKPSNAPITSTVPQTQPKQPNSPPTTTATVPQFEMSRRPQHKMHPRYVGFRKKPMVVHHYHQRPKPVAMGGYVVII